MADQDEYKELAKQKAKKVEAPQSELEKLFQPESEKASKKKLKSIK